MQKIGIYYFSGTGNTALAAEMLRAEFRQLGTSVDVINIEKILNDKFALDIAKYDVIGIGFPVYGFGASRIVDDFVDLLPDETMRRNRKVFVFKTAADPHSINNSAAYHTIRKLESKGYDVAHDSIIAMPCNFIIKYDDCLVKQLLRTSKKKTAQIAADVMNGDRNYLKQNYLLSFLCHMVHVLEEEYGAKAFGKSLSVNSDCTQCGKCMEICPSHNITTNGNTIQFGSKCRICMRCIYACPNRAIYSKKYGFCILKEGFNGGINIKAIDENDQISDVFVTKETKGYYKHFYKYFYNYF